MNRTITLVSLFLLAGFGLLSAQSAAEARQIAATYLQAHAADFGLTEKDVSEFKLTDSYASPDGTRHLYFQQTYRAMGVQGAVAGVHVKNGKVGYATSEFLANVADRVATTSLVLDSRTAVIAAARQLDIAATGSPTLKSRNTDGSFTYQWTEISSEPITVSSVLFPATDRQVYAAWNVGIDQRHTPDVYQIFVDGQDGHLLHRMNLTRYCSFHGTNHTHAGDKGAARQTAAPALPLHRAMLESSLTKATLVDGATYNVFPYTIEAPLYGERELLVEPADPMASPFGWHDTNGQDGAEFTFTRGNNVHAYPDADDNNEADDFVTDGGDSLLFDFYYAEGANPDTLLPAAVTQLFYMSNSIHDFTWHHGFDEAAGNFQQRNYSGEGAQNDYVRAEAQDGAGLNNANFSTPVDGSRPRMQMFLWDNSSNSVMSVGSPASVAGNYSTVTADFGDEIGANPVTAQLAIATSGQAGITGEQVCSAVSNVAEVTGKIALIRRGECNFEDKVFFAEQAGAVGVIICNAGAAIGGMTGPGDFPVTIPSVLIAESACISLRALINGGTPVTATFQALDIPLVDGDFDNGIIAHEYGHGISNRTIGGPGNSSCLQNDEQMGEGWSDFFTLAMAARPDQDGTENRGIGNFASGANTTSGGIRRLPYSTDFSVNDNTYDRIITSGTAPHPLGEIWASTLWDLYWAMVDEYGFDENVMSGNGGNNQAVRLVIEGMKFTDCGPGLVDGRNGILAADLLINDGANQCLIWSVFARRGMGYLAEQGSANDRTDNTENFEVLPECIKTLKISKSTTTPLVAAGDEADYQLTIVNHKDETATKVSVKDIIPAGMTLVAGSVNGATFTTSGNSLVFDLGDMESGDEISVSYSVLTDIALPSTELFFDGAENGDNAVEIIANVGLFPWEVVDTTPYAGGQVFFINNVPTENDQILQFIEPLTIMGEQPVLRFFQKYDIEPGFDGGFVEISLDETTWQKVDSRVIRGNYRGLLESRTLNDANIQSWWGTRLDYFETLIDMSDLVGEDVFIRWHFASDEGVGKRAWWVDNIELMDLVNYDTEACATSAEGDMACANAPAAGVVIESDLVSSANDPRLGNTEVAVFPNPASDHFNVRITNETRGTATLRLTSVDGRLIEQREVDLLGGTNAPIRFATNRLPAGMYLLQVSGAEAVHTAKITVE